VRAAAGLKPASTRAKPPHGLIVGRSQFQLLCATAFAGSTWFDIPLPLRQKLVLESKSIEHTDHQGECMKADATTAVLPRPLALWLLTAGGFFAFFTFGFVDTIKGPTLPNLLADLHFSYSPAASSLAPMWAL
jgi:hypothetical protein